MSARPPCRLHLLKATHAPIACVIGRGPTRWFHIALWRYDECSVEHGAWTKIKLYPERCALSPDGSLLVVFALGGEWGPYFAVSRAPWLHALAAWETVGTWTTGAHIDEAGTLTLAGCAGEVPFHGHFPGPTACLPVDTHWVRGGLHRELHTGWELAALRRSGIESIERAPWIDDLPSPISACPDAVVASKKEPDGERRLIIVNLYERQREYYLLDDGQVSPLEEVVAAEWGSDGQLLTATRSGHLQVLDLVLTPVWAYDMDIVEPKPAPAPDWARKW